ncbi:glycosyltransferase [Aeromonas caviae]|uniref:glycosyltransferase n=1 Tax=Aeromonas caviae TaxID=648 RepID=UPI0029D54BC1|nr:glycosyltransferase [Aeromonas caviae]MDX7949432.1 glycosyltransferase [Aeromonas caviae]
MSDKQNFSVGVILPTYNGERWLAATIDSVLNQTYGDIKLYIIDDGSVDGTIGIINTYMKKYPGKIILLPKTGIRGAPGSRMDVALKISDKYIAFIDQDDIWLCDKIRVQIDDLKLTGATLSFTDIEIIDERGCKKHGVADSENLKRKLFNYNASKWELAGSFVEYCPVRIGTVLISRDAFLASGGFDTTLFGGEDWEFWVRYCALGYTIKYKNEILALRRVHGTNTSFTYRVKRLENWLKAAGKIQSKFPRLKDNVNKFYILTYYRTIISCLKKNDSDAVIDVIKLFDKQSGVKFKNKVIVNILVSLWPLIKPMYSMGVTIRNYILSWKINLL